MFSTISHYAVLVKINSFSIFAHDGLAKEKKDNSANLGSFSNQKGSYSFLCHMYRKVKNMISLEHNGKNNNI